ncbi:hypothetical protein D9M68_736850 [compost metagenome]
MLVSDHAGLTLYSRPAEALVALKLRLASAKRSLPLALALMLLWSSRPPKLSLRSPEAVSGSSSNRNSAALSVLVLGTNASSPSAEKPVCPNCVPTTPAILPIFACLASKRASQPRFLKIVPVSPSSISLCS